MLDPQSLVQLLLSQADEHAFTFLDEKDRFVEWSAGADKVYGYARDEVIGRSARMIFTPERDANSSTRPRATNGSSVPK